MDESKTFNWHDASNGERMNFAARFADGTGFAAKLAYEAYAAAYEVERAMRDYETATQHALADAQYTLDNLKDGKVAAPTHQKLDERYQAVRDAGDRLSKAWYLFTLYRAETATEG